MPTKTDYQYIRFVEVPMKNRKTKVFDCHNITYGSLLGMVKWDGAWRQYVYETLHIAQYSAGCLADIQDFITNLTHQRKTDVQR